MYGSLQTHRLFLFFFPPFEKTGLSHPFLEGGVVRDSGEAKGNGRKERAPSWGSLSSLLRRVGRSYRETLVRFFRAAGSKNVGKTFPHIGTPETV